MKRHNPEAIYFVVFRVFFFFFCCCSVVSSLFRLNGLFEECKKCEGCEMSPVWTADMFRIPLVYMYVTVNTTNSVSDVLCQVDFVPSDMYLNSQC